MKQSFQKSLRGNLKNILKGEQRTQLGPFVLRFKFKENRIYFITFRHHDKVY